MNKKPVKIALITGYLGSGKTTLLNHILANTEGIRAAVIVKRAARSSGPTWSPS